MSIFPQIISIFELAEQLIKTMTKLVNVVKNQEENQFETNQWVDVGASTQKTTAMFKMLLPSRQMPIARK